MVARRHRGRYSPNGAGDDPRTPPADRFAGRPARRVHGGARLLYLAAIPMLVAAIVAIFSGDAVGTALRLGAFGLFFAAAVLINEGLRAEEAYNARSVARPPAIPRKLLGAVAAGAGIALGARIAWQLDLLSSGIFGLVGLAAAILGFGPDPMRAKGIADFDSRRAAEAVERAEAMLAEMLEAARGFRDRALEARVEHFAAAAREMFRAVEQDPRDLSRARKFLGVYLTGARDATVKFAAIHARSPDAKARSDYEALLDDLEASFNAHRAELLNDDRAALDVEIEVLRKRLRREGLA
ncbi:MAG: hypothetical protein KatS3mg118_1350 [Paracoccaceae bacterium]|nr:MAG: hypothetical protein D6686_07280 [Alphaproteobacteria bacterium]GIX13391.1 MAG: hypothetical protein KatS3mg118_1350 [Paracoccaceae bacterium]